MANIAAILQARGIKGSYGGGSQTLVTEYRLDEYWLLKCYCLNRLQREKCIMYDRHLEPGPTYVTVPAPTNFTGVWIEYYINGRTCFESNMKGGVRCGDRTCYSPDGSKVYVEQYEPNSSEVGWTEFYHSVASKRRANLLKPEHQSVLGRITTSRAALSSALASIRQ